MLDKIDGVDRWPGKLLPSLLGLGLFMGACQAQPGLEPPREPVASVGPTAPPTEMPGAYLAQALPDATPVVFAPGLVSVDGRYEYGLAVAPDGNEIFFTAESPGAGLTVIRRQAGGWTEPAAADLRGAQQWEFEAFFTVDGEKLFFASGEADAPRIWQVEKGTDGWQSPAPLDGPVNTGNVFWPTVTRAGTLYYSDIDRGKIYRARLVNGAYPAVEEVGLPAGSYHPFVSPDERFVLFNSKRLGGSGQSDLFVSFRRNESEWEAPQNLGPAINTAYGETCASLSPDGRYIFFSRYDEPGEIANIYWASVPTLLETPAGE